MKTGDKIISHLFGPSNQKWQETRCIRVLLGLLPPVLSRGVRYAKFQNDVLIIALESHSLKAEFYHKRPVLKSLFNKLQSETKICAGYEIKDFKLIVSPPPETNEPIPVVIRFAERAEGLFENRAENPAIYEAIERIRKSIQK
ncbi:MAG: hypothetical protein AB7E49_08480 [Campylobacterales bacterium]